MMERDDPGRPQQTRRLRLGGRVQGVGFRPFVARCAQQCGITGSVCNLGGEVEIIAQGSAAQLTQFIHHLITAAPPLAQPQLRRDETIDAPHHPQFAILASRSEAQAEIHLPADQPLCDECRRELNDPGDRRYRYPFINCTQCGPRYTLIERLPYDRANTAMAGFPLCAACRAEYHDRDDRRHHAEANACPQCGPRLQWRRPPGGVAPTTPLSRRERGAESAIALDAQREGPADAHQPPLDAAVQALHAGEIVALKGVGGYHLLCDARSEVAVARLRLRKQRPTKPLAVMFPWRGASGLDGLGGEVVAGALEQARLLSPERPIVLCPRHPTATLAAGIAPGLGEIGVLLPYAPLHQLLLDRFDGPLVATSGNVSGEPVLSDNAQAEQRLASVADGFLHHNRPILRPVDDSLYRTIAGATRPLRLGRGGTPLELTLPRPLDRPLVAVGGHLKNSVALAWQSRLVLSPHIGDLDTPRGMQLFAQLIAELQRLYGVTAEALICDAHPDYASTRWARASGLPVTAVLHHHAHAAALYGEHHASGEWLVFTWDGSGYGGDGTLWGGEAFVGRPAAWQRFASLLPFHLPGGEKAGRQPWRSALALCWEAGRDWPQAEIDTTLLRHAWQRGLNTPPSSAVGRLFDGAAALLGLCHEAHYEGEAAARLEACAHMADEQGALPLLKGSVAPWLIDWQPLLPVLLDAPAPVAERAGAFHQILAATIVAVAHQARRAHGITTVGLSGGVFQNRLLTTLACARLRADGFAVRLATQLPCNDGALAFGQVIDYLYRQEPPRP